MRPSCLCLLFALCLAEGVFSDGRRFEPYSVLGVHRRATTQEIRKAYKSLARQWHPDKNREDPAEAEEKFIEITRAYELLSDPERRRNYDNKVNACLLGGLVLCRTILCNFSLGHHRGLP